MRLATKTPFIVTIIMSAAFAAAILTWQFWPSGISDVEAVTLVQNACTFQNTSLDFEGTTTVRVGDNAPFNYETKGQVQNWDMHRIDRIVGGSKQYETIDFWGGKSYHRETAENGNWGEWIIMMPFPNEVEMAEALEEAMKDPELAAQIKELADAEAASAQNRSFCGSTTPDAVKYMGDEDLEGIDTRKFVSYVDIKDLIDLTGTDNYDRTTYWVDEAGKLLRVQVESFRGAWNDEPERETTIVVELSEYGEPNTITAPDFS